MAIGIICGVIIAVAAIISIILANVFDGAARGIFTTLSVFAIIAFLIVPFSFHTVETGEVAVVKHLGEATKVRTAGSYFDFWITEKYDRYDAKVQNLDITIPTYSKDAQTMDVAMTIQYQIDATKAVNIAQQYGSLEILANRIQSVSIEKAKAVLTGYSAMNIIENRSSISPEVEAAIREAIDENYYVNIVAVVLTNIDFSDAFEATVENKMIAEQERLKAQYEKETAIVNAEKELEVSKLQAQARLEQAKAEAQAVIEKAQAEALSTQLKSIEVARALGFEINDTIITDDSGATSVEYTIDFEGKSPEEIQLITDYLKHIEYLTKWNGTLPTVVNGESTAVIMPND